ncbi:MAG: c-type cytochrome [Desulfuromonadales bacterium]|nr:c-type cytochrome [Desulfuromonadales bacterium]
MSAPPPHWLTPLLTVAAALAAAAVFAALFFGGRPGHDHGHGPIADITVNLGGREVREHCTTCHPQGGRPHGPAHPEISPHRWEVLGCTACHLGEGMALDERLSHGLPGRGARGVLSGQELQASCYTCHELAPLPGAERAWRGYELFRENACDSCHSLAPTESGGRYGPPLGEIGSYLGLERLLEAIRDPKKEPANSTMPRFPLSARQAQEITWFLKSRVKNPFYATPMQLQTGQVRLPPVPAVIPEALPMEGALLASRRCLACHRFGEEDGRLAPDLSWIGSMRPVAYLGDFLANPARQIPGASMPQIPMSAAEKDLLLAFLQHQATGPLTLEHGEDDPFAHPPAAVENQYPKQLYMALCQRCHAAAGDGFGLIAPNLANFPRPFAGNAEFFRRTPDPRLVAAIDRGVPGTSMPPYGSLLEKAEIDGLLDLLFAAFIGIPRDEKVELPPLPAAEPAAPELADPLYASYCQRCHGRFGTGRGPEQLQHRPRPRDLTNRPYFAHLDRERIARAIADGVAGTAMPPFRHRLTPAEIGALVDKIRRLAGEDDARTDQPSAPAVAP